MRNRGALNTDRPGSRGFWHALAGVGLRARAAYHRALGERRVRQWRRHIAKAEALEARIAALSGGR